MAFALLTSAWGYIGFGGLMMGGAVLSSGLQSLHHLDEVNEAIKDANNHFNDLDGKWKNVFKKQAEISKQEQDSIVTTFNDINDSISKANATHELIKGQCKQIQTIGIILVLFIFILLLMKHNDLFNLFN
jgi:hypothetical protein